MTREERMETARKTAIEARRDLEITDFPDEQDDQSLIQWAEERLGKIIQIRHARTQTAHACWTLDHWEILLPSHSSDPFLARRQLIHEIGHCLLSQRGLPLRPDDGKDSREAQRAEDEIVEAFASEWLLPADLAH